MNGDVDLAPILQRIYENRFPPDKIEAMRAVWRVLVCDFFQSRVSSDATVLDVGAGACPFINEVAATRRIAIDTPYGLSGYVVSDDLDHARRAAARLHTETCT
jgi:hypothetical protein